MNHQHPLPSDDVLLNHGLTRLSLDLPRKHRSNLSSSLPASATLQVAEEWPTGLATLNPVEQYPLLRPVQEREDRRVRFSFCPYFDAAALPRFRRQAQFLALDTLFPLSQEHASSSTSSSSSAQYPPLSPGPSSSLSSPNHVRHYGRAKAVIAWWEDEHGYWLITDEEEEERIGLVEWWSRILEHDEGQGNDAPDHANTLMQRYAEVCETLLQVVNCLRALHDKKLALQSCRPNSFVIIPQSPFRAQVVRYSEANIIPGFSLPAVLGSDSLGTSPLFQRDGLDLTGHLSDHFIRKNLRYLAPDAVATRRTTPNGDIYSFGVLAYELLTGSTIDGGPDSPDEADIDPLADIHKHVTVDFVSPLTYLEREADFGAYNPDLPPKPLSDIVMKCLEKDTDDRYASFDSLAWDLAKLGQICRLGGDLEKFSVGEVDQFSRFSLPHRPICREDELAFLSRAFRTVQQASTSNKDSSATVYSTQVVSVWAPSGSGKSRLVNHWARKLETADGGSKCLVGYAKLDEHVRKPLSSFIQLLQCLLDRVLTARNEDPKAWSKMIRDVLGNQFPFFLALLPNEYRRLITMGIDVKPADIAERDNFEPAFRLGVKRLLQLFATAERPLVLVVDDTQWLQQEEIDLWRTLLDGAHPLNHMLVVSCCRTETSDSCPTAHQLSTSSTSLFVPRLGEDGVRTYLNECFHDRVEKLDSLASFLFAETGGNPLFLRTMIQSLAKDGVMRFDFGMLLWRFDSLALETHLSDAGIDAYLGRLMGGLPAEVKEVLQALAILPSTGCSVNLLARFLGKTVDDVERSLQAAVAFGSLVHLQGGIVRFAHDRAKNAAYSLTPDSERGHLHHQVSAFLRRPSYVEDFVFDAADHALFAKELGAGNDDLQGLFKLLLDAAQKAALSTTFAFAKHYLDEAQEIIDQTGGFQEWVKVHRSLYLRFLGVYSEVCSALKLHDQAFPKLYEMVPFCETDAERLRIAALRVRMKISANRIPEAMALTWKTLADHGYDPVRPTRIKIKPPSSVEDVERLEKSLIDRPLPEDDVRVAILGILSAAASIIYITQPDSRAAAFALAYSIVEELGCAREVPAHLIAMTALTTHDIPIKEALCRVSKDLCDLRSEAYLTCSVRVTIAGQAHCWSALRDLHDELAPTFKLCLAHGNYDQAGYVLCIELGVMALSSSYVKRWEEIAMRYEAVRPFVGPAFRVLLNSPLQYCEALARYDPQSRPWEMEGIFITRNDLDSPLAFPLHKSMWGVFALRLAVLYNAPLQEQQLMVERLEAQAPALIGVVHGVEFSFLAALVKMRSGATRKEIDPHVAEVERHGKCTGFHLRHVFLKAMEHLTDQGLDKLVPIEAAIKELDDYTEFTLSGLLNFYTGLRLVEEYNAPKLGSGYVRAAFFCYEKVEAFGLCAMLRDRYTNMVPRPRAAKQLPSQMPGLGMPANAPPVLRRASISTSNETGHTPTTSTPSGESTEQGHGTDDSLDTLTLMRSSLALASEQDPPILLCTLLRILCQFTRADYAAIGLCDESEKTVTRLRAAGPYGRILPYDIDISDEACQTLCPAAYMLHVSRTGKAISRASNLPHLRTDPFYAHRHPRSIVCIPILNQGVQAGVILLSSSTSTSTQAQSAGAREVIGCLATFATIVTTNYSFTRRLKSEVDQRTKELSSALAAKTQFLSQCSHELRSPLSAVLGLAAVLEASPGLSAVQREHLRTIISSGEDLLGLISNILDHSRLESGSVTLEHIPFDLREVVEGALDSIAAVAQKKNLELCLLSSFKTDPPGMLGDPFRIKQILLNLLSNAVKFTSKGKVTARWRWEKVQDDRIKVTLDVEDTGLGIPAQKMDKLFRSFSQIDESITRSFGGSGLGLIISKDLARLLGGDCTATSEYGKGSVFSFSFVADRNPDPPREWKDFKSPQSCFVLCEPGPWWEMLEQNLLALNCQPVRFTEDVRQCILEDFPEGLNSHRDFNFILVNTDMIDSDILGEMRRLQPKSKFVFLVRSVDLAKAMREFEIERESIVARPIKFESLYNAMLRHGDKDEDPAMASRTPSKTKKGPNRELSKQYPMSICLVDDNPTNRLVGKKIIELFGYENIDTANDGQQAVEIAEKKQYDVILLDLQMPILDGFTAQKRIKASPLAGDPCVIALTANADQSTQTHCAEAGFFNYLSKPLDIPKLEKLLVSAYDYRHASKSGSMVHPV